MKYVIEIDLDLPLEQVIALFDHPNNLAKWQPDLVHAEHLSGIAGNAGAKTRLRYKMGNREITMTETVIRRNLPEEFSGKYEADGVLNIQSNSFKRIGARQTRWTAENDFQFKGFMKLMGWFMPGAFKKQSLKYMEQFKAFAEGQPQKANKMHV